MLRLVFPMLLVCCLAALLGGCQDNDTADTTPAAGTQPDTALERGQEATQDAAEAVQEGAQQLGEEVKETTGQALETVKEGYANFTEEARSNYPRVVAAMQKQFDAMNKAAVEEYRGSFADDAPERDKLVAAFKDEATYKPKYTIETFTVDSATETEAVATVHLTYTGTDVAKPLATQHKTYKYTFRKAPDSDDWKVYKVEPAA